MVISLNIHYYWLSQLEINHVIQQPTAKQKYKFWLVISKAPVQRENRLRDSLGKFISLHKARAAYCWEVGADTKLYPDLALGNSLCLCRCKPKSEKKIFFSWHPMPLKIELLPRGRPHGVPSMPNNLERFKSTPSQ
jgi:hypothetical protein